MFSKCVKVLIIVQICQQVHMQCPIGVATYCDELCDDSIDDEMRRTIYFTGEDAQIECLDGTTITVNAVIIKTHAYTMTRNIQAIPMNKKKKKNDWPN